jgi:N-acetylmuramoyl-L-alanine amidase
MSFQFTPPARAVHSLFFHCSASDRPEHDDVGVMRDWHVKGNGWSDVGYHFYVRRDGTIQPGRSLELTPAAQGAEHNAGTIAVCLGGLTKSKFTEAQFRAGYAIVEAVNDAYTAKGIRIRVRGHREVFPKACPVFDYRQAFGLDGMGYPVREPDFRVQAEHDEQPIPHSDDLYILMPQDERVRALQERLNAKGFDCGNADGRFGRLTYDAVRAFQAANGLVVTGIADQATRTKLASV